MNPTDLAIVPAISTATFADKLNQLFRTVRPQHGREYSNEEVASALRDLGGPTISGTYLWQLRKGIRDNPTKRHLEALAQFFAVPVGYFFDDPAAAQIEDELSLIAAVRNDQVRRLVVRAADLSQDSLSGLMVMVDMVRRLEGRAG